MNPVEIRLLLTCARTELDDRLTTLLASLCTKQVNWEKIVQAAIIHRVMPLLFINFQKAGNRCAPYPVLNKLKTLYYTNLQHSLAISCELRQLSDLFCKRDIEFIPIKGPALAQSVYGDIALRQYADLDILVQKTDITSVYQLLLHEGYRPEIQLNTAQLSAYSKTEYSLCLNNSATRVTVELHWDLTGRYTYYPLDIDSLDGRVDGFEVEGMHFKQLSSEDQLIYLCIHGSKDGWRILDCICCVAELIRSRKDIDWARVIDRSNRMRCRRMVFVGIQLANDMLAAPVEKKVIKIIETDPVAIKLASKINQTVLELSIFSKEVLVPPNFSLFHFSIRESVTDKLRYLFYLLLVPTRRDWHIMTLPARFAFLYYLLRPLRLLAETFYLGLSKLKSKWVVPQVKRLI